MFKKGPVCLVKPATGLVVYITGQLPIKVNTLHHAKTYAQKIRGPVLPDVECQCCGRYIVTQTNNIWSCYFCDPTNETSFRCGCGGGFFQSTKTPWWWPTLNEEQQSMHLHRQVSDPHESGKLKGDPHSVNNANMANIHSP